MKKILTLYFTIISAFGIYAHPKPLNLNQLIHTSAILVSGEIVSVNRHQFTLSIDSIFYGNYRFDTIEILDQNQFYPEYTDRIKNNYRKGDKKLVFITISECQYIEYHSAGIYLEGEITVKNDTVTFDSKEYSSRNFLTAVLDYRVLIGPDCSKVSDEVFFNNFSSRSFLHAALIAYECTVLLDKQVDKSQYPIAPSPVISATKMNVLILGIDNPIQVAYSNTDSKELVVFNSNGTIQSLGNGYFIVKPDTLAFAEILVCKANSSGHYDTLGSMIFRVKKIPDPTARIPGMTNGTISKNLLSASSIRVECTDYDYDFYFKVHSFFMTNSMDTLVLKSCDNNLTTEMKAKIESLPASAKVLFYDIIVETSDKIIRKISDIECTIK